MNTGEKFGRLTILREVDRKGKYRMVECQCDCGRLSVKRLGHLTAGATRSCGCLSIETSSARSKTHGFSHSGNSEYLAWKGMHARCTNANRPDYKNYGGRGISVCARWSDFLNFLQDMGPKPTARHSLERKNNSVGYSPDNCVWATRSEQARNRRTTRMLLFGGKTQSAVKWAEDTGIDLKLICSRLSRGWSIERALTTPEGRAAGSVQIGPSNLLHAGTAGIDNVSL